jgi:hypothetical protein
MMRYIDQYDALTIGMNYNAALSSAQTGTTTGRQREHNKKK